jgi:hypothetical protein
MDDVTTDLTFAGAVYIFSVHLPGPGKAQCRSPWLALQACPET